jgi:ABC-type uncharacterized transport system substrate-binding protein
MASRKLRLALAVALPLLGGAAPAPASEAAVVVLKPGAKGVAAQLVQALTRALQDRQAPPRLVELSGDSLADAARITREARGETVLYAVGPDATEAAAEARGTAVISLGVPNPARVRTAGTYVSMYPRLERVFDHVHNEMKAQRAGLVFSPARNREVALAFLKAGTEAGVAVTPIPVASSGELVRELKGALPRVDVLLLAIDPLLFDSESLKFIVDEAAAAGKPTVGFLEELTRLGVSVALVAPPQAAASAAVEAAASPVLIGKKRVEVDSQQVVLARPSAQGPETPALAARDEAHFAEDSRAGLR